MSESPAVALVDALALRDHWAIPASEPHQRIAERLWPTLRALGVSDRGLSRPRLLVEGVDAHVFARLNAEMDGQRLWGQYTVHTAPVPAPDGHKDLRLGRYASGDRGFDVVIVNPAHSDVRLHDPDYEEARTFEQAEAVRQAVFKTSPIRGITAALVSHTVLDSPTQTNRRQAIEGFGDLLGAVRLPGGALRAAAGCDLPVDLLIFRAGGPARARRGEAFGTTLLTDVGGGHLPINEYFHKHPEHVLGFLATHHNPWGPPMLAVTPNGGDVWQQVETVLGRIVEAHAPVPPDEPIPSGLTQSATPGHDVEPRASRDGVVDAIDGQESPTIADYVRRRADPGLTRNNPPRDHTTGARDDRPGNEPSSPSL